jgi:hypothetical protein
MSQSVENHPFIRTIREIVDDVFSEETQTEWLDFRDLLQDDTFRTIDQETYVLHMRCIYLQLVSGTLATLLGGPRAMMADPVKMFTKMQVLNNTSKQHPKYASTIEGLGTIYNEAYGSSRTNGVGAMVDTFAQHVTGRKLEASTNRALMEYFMSVNQKTEAQLRDVVHEDLPKGVKAFGQGSTQPERKSNGPSIKVDAEELYNKLSAEVAIALSNSFKQKYSQDHGTALVACILNELRTQHIPQTEQFFERNRTEVLAEIKHLKDDAEAVVKLSEIGDAIAHVRKTIGKNPRPYLVVDKLKSYGLYLEPENRSRTLEFTYTPPSAGGQGCLILLASSPICYLTVRLVQQLLS